MALPASMVDPMLSAFRGMMAEIDGKGLTGPNVDEMRTQLGFMERLAQEMDDIAAYSGRLAQENTFMRFSDAYGKVLSSAAQPAAAARGGAEPSDEELLANAVAAYDQALASYKSGQAGDDGARLAPYVERIVAIGRSGVSYPVFLRMLEEEGLNKALSGAAPAVRDALERDLAFARAAFMPHQIAECEAVLAMYDELVARAPFGQPDPLEFSLRRRRIEWRYEPVHRHYKAMIDRWEHMLTCLVDWLDAFTSFAPSDDRWISTEGKQATLRNVRRTQECGPGEFRYREAVFRRYFGVDWEGIWRSESFRWEYTANRISWTDERLHLVRATYAHCVPGGKPPDELIEQAKQHWNQARPGVGQAPPPGTPLRSFIA